MHVTLRMAKRVWNLRSERSFSVLHGALDDTARSDFRVVHFSILGDHLHLIAEAGGTRSLTSGVRGLSIRIARRLNRMMESSGPVFEDRFHVHVLRTPTEVRNAVRYVLGNYANHMRRIGVSVSGEKPDRFSSAAASAPRVGQLELWGDRATRTARTWLLSTSSAAPRPPTGE